VKKKKQNTLKEMARTKFTARKSQGGLAPSKQLGVRKAKSGSNATLNQSIDILIDMLTRERVRILSLQNDPKYTEDAWQRINGLGLTEIEKSQNEEYQKLKRSILSNDFEVKQDDEEEEEEEEEINIMDEEIPAVSMGSFSKKAMKYRPLFFDESFNLPFNPTGKTFAKMLQDWKKNPENLEIAWTLLTRFEASHFTNAINLFIKNWYKNTEYEDLLEHILSYLKRESLEIEQFEKYIQTQPEMLTSQEKYRVRLMWQRIQLFDLLTKTDAGGQEARLLKTAFQITSSF